MLRRILLYLILALCGTVAVQQYLLHRRAEKISGLSQQIVDSEKRLPETITITDTKIVTKYQTGKTVNQWKVPAGYVRFEIGDYRRAVEDLGELRAKFDSVKALPEKSQPDTVTIVREIEKKERLLRQPDSFVTIQRSGFHLALFAGIGYSGHVQPILGAQILFWQRYFSGIGVSTESCGVLVGRRMGDLIPLTKNLSLGVMGGIKYEGGLVIMPAALVNL